MPKKLSEDSINNASEDGIRRLASFCKLKDCFVKSRKRLIEELQWGGIVESPTFIGWY